MHKHKDAGEDLALMKSRLKDSAFRSQGGAMRAAGGKVGLTGGAQSGEGRLERNHAIKRSGALHAPGEIEGEGTAPKLHGGRRRGGTVSFTRRDGGAVSFKRGGKVKHRDCGGSTDSDMKAGATPTGNVTQDSSGRYHGLKHGGKARKDGGNVVFKRGGKIKHRDDGGGVDDEMDSSSLLPPVDFPSGPAKPPLQMTPPPPLKSRNGGRKLKPTPMKGSGYQG